MQILQAPKRETNPAVAHPAGEPLAELAADLERLKSVLGWRPEHDDLDFIVRTALEWERRTAAGDPRGSPDIL